MKGFNLYWGAGVALIFFIGGGVISARFLNLTGNEFYFFMMLMGTLGITASAFFVFFQNKAQAKMAAGAAGAGAGGGAVNVAGAGGSPEIEQLIKDADQRLSASKGTQGAA